MSTASIDADPRCGCPMVAVELDRAERRRLARNLNGGLVADTTEHVPDCWVAVPELISLPIGAVINNDEPDEVSIPATESQAPSSGLSLASLRESPA